MSWSRGFEDFVRQKVPLAERTTYRVGGPAEFYVQPPDEATLGELLWRAAHAGLPVKFLGGGSNLLVGDEGVRGIVVRLPQNGFGALRRHGNVIRAGAAHSLPRLVNWTVSEGLLGLECLQGVPGTIGAALRMNAGGKYGDVGRFVRHVRGFELDGKRFEFEMRECGFGYRHSKLAGRIVTECEIELMPGNPETGRRLALDIDREKRASQPMDAHSAGCVFKNPSVPGVPSAGRLIDELGLKGHQVGGAAVSKMHANFLVNENGASAQDLTTLIRDVRQRVFDARGVMLELEIEVWGIPPEELGAAV
ncbi:MAG TPA: UDP-N-acetylmuramate dehydrogenase [Planctomycetota bacterium]|jgi:UDP-N-acetylmuramate dehydrogenase